MHTRTRQLADYAFSGVSQELIPLIEIHWLLQKKERESINVAQKSTALSKTLRIQALMLAYPL